MTQVFSNIDSWRAFHRAEMPIDKSLGFVPTMGNLHNGHASLLQRSLTENNMTVLSIFVNPTQFNEDNDYQNYPNTFNEDLALAQALGVDFVLQGNYADLYPDDYHYRIEEQVISQGPEGIARPGHFTGMMTIVMKLLQLVRPQRVYFGEKDYQQLRLVQGMVEAFFLDVEVIGCATLRDAAGLALSSRNNLLADNKIPQARLFSKILQSDNGLDTIRQELKRANFKVDYVQDWQGRRCAAVWLDNVRLIDNVPIVENEGG